MPLFMLLADLDASVTESPDSLPVKETRLLKEVHFCCGVRTEEAMENPKHFAKATKSCNI